MTVSAADVLRLHPPRADVVPVVFDSPHSGERYPDDFAFLPPRAIVRRAEDTHVARLWSHAPRHGATLLEACFPRAYIDANRGLGEIDPQLLADTWPLPLAPSAKTARGIGLVWRLAPDGTPLYAQQLKAAEIERRIATYWMPYHQALSDVLDALHARFGSVWHVNCHSMPSVGDPLAEDAGRRRADFVLGDRDGTTCAASFIHYVADEVSAMGYEVAINDPYKGVEIVRRHGRPAVHRHSLQIEINRALYMDEETLVPNGGFDRLARNLDCLQGAICRYACAAIQLQGGVVRDEIH